MKPIGPGPRRQWHRRLTSRALMSRRLDLSRTPSSPPDDTVMVIPSCERRPTRRRLATCSLASETSGMVPMTKAVYGRYRLYVIMMAHRCPVTTRRRDDERRARGYQFTKALKADWHQPTLKTHSEESQKLCQPGPAAKTSDTKSENQKLLEL